MRKINKPVVLKDWCSKNGYPGVTKECVASAFNSDDKEIQNLAKREKLKGLIKDG